MGQTRIPMRKQNSDINRRMWFSAAVKGAEPKLEQAMVIQQTKVHFLSKLEHAARRLRGCRGG